MSNQHTLKQLINPSHGCMVRYSQKLWALLLVLTFPLLTTASSCEEIFDAPKAHANQKKYQKMYTNMTYKLNSLYGIKVESYLKGVKGFYSLEEKQIFHRKHGSKMSDALTLHHETVHATTLEKILNSPSIDTLVRGIRLSRKEQAIDEQMPEGYKHDFLLDELNAHKKTSSFILGAIKNDRNEVEEQLQLYSMLQQTQSTTRNMADATTRALKETLNELTLYLDGQPSLLEVPGIHLFSKHSDHVFSVELRLHQANGQPLEVYIPVYASKIENGYINGLEAKLMESFEKAIEYAEHYKNLGSK